MENSQLSATRNGSTATLPLSCEHPGQYLPSTADLFRLIVRCRNPQAKSTLAEMNNLFLSGGGFGTDESLQSHEWDQHVSSRSFVLESIRLILPLF